jgi:triosephosphate isomerase
MRKKLVAGNWKMNKLHDEAESLFTELLKRINEVPDGVDVMIAPPALYLAQMATQAGSRLALGAQDVSHRQEQGAYTGEYSAEMLKSAGVRYAIIGHSERREYHGENDELIRRKIAACVAAGIRPVYCCGEALEEREKGRHAEVVLQQVSTALQGFSSKELADLVIAYEPAWAIGTGKTATASQAQEMHAEIRKILSERFSSEFAESVRILYGGSAKPSNAAELFSQPDVDGGLIGGASLNADDFLRVAASAP